MKVLLKEDVEHLGYAGEIYKVADGFGRNYLLPRGYAVMATKGAMRQAEAWADRAAARRAQIQAEYDRLSDAISGVVLHFEARAGSTGRLYGSITAQQVAEKLAEKVGIETDRRYIQSEALRDLGEHSLTYRLDATHEPSFTVVIRLEGSAEAEALAAAMEEAVGDLGELGLDLDADVISDAEADAILDADYSEYEV
jgi:large subunit ribosomal protein L9